MSKRARKGGEVGINGEMYDGGKFMPSTRLPKRSPSSKTPRSNRRLVMPGMIATIPEGAVAVYPADPRVRGIRRRRGRGRAVRGLASRGCAPLRRPGRLAPADQEVQRRPTPLPQQRGAMMA